MSEISYCEISAAFDKCFKTFEEVLAWTDQLKDAEKGLKECAAKIGVRNNETELVESSLWKKPNIYSGSLAFLKTLAASLEHFSNIPIDFGPELGLEVPDAESGLMVSEQSYPNDELAKAQGDIDDAVNRYIVMVNGAAI